MISEACSENADCPSGRMCKFGLCLCGQPDFCEGHYKPVCGSDGRLYPSHCELHRTACVLGVHIRLDHESKCGIKSKSFIRDLFEIKVKYKKIVFLICEKPTMSNAHY